MADIFTPQKRSEVMARIRSKNTTPERIVFRHLRLHKVYFQRHYRRAAGCPDIALPRKRRAVFIDGDFWHGWNFEERRLKLEERQQYFWIRKIERNMERDRLNRAILEAAGWQVLQVWEHQLSRKAEREETLSQVLLFLTRPPA